MKASRFTELEEVCNRVGCPTPGKILSGGGATIDCKFLTVTTNCNFDRELPKRPSRMRCAAAADCQRQIWFGNPGRALWTECNVGCGNRTDGERITFSTLPECQLLRRCTLSRALPCYRSGIVQFALRRVRPGHTASQCRRRRLHQPARRC